MALGTSTSYNGGPLVFLTPRAKSKDGHKLDKPYFSVGRVDKDGKIAQTEEQPTEVSGDLVSLDIKEREFKTQTGATEKRDEVSLYLRDNQVNETYRLPLGFQIAPRSVFNALASLKEKRDFGGLKVSYFRKKNGFEGYALEQRGQKVSWKYEIDQLPAAEKITDKRGNVVKTDFSEVDDFFKKELLEIAEILNAGKPKSQANNSVGNVAEKNSPVSESTENQGVEQVEDESEVPF